MYCWLLGKAEAGGTPGGGDAPGGPGVLKAEAGGTPGGGDTPGGGFKGVCDGVDMLRYCVTASVEGSASINLQ